MLASELNKTNLAVSNSGKISREEYEKVLTRKVLQESWDMYEEYGYLAKKGDGLSKISLIDSLSRDFRDSVEMHISPRDLAFYNLMQGDWIETEKYHLGKNTNHDPSQLELAEDFERTQTPQRYELAHLLSWPWNVSFFGDEVMAEREGLIWLLGEAERKFGQPYRSEFYEKFLLS